MLRIAVCDDEIVAVKLISSALTEQFAKRGLGFEIETFLNGNVLAEKIRLGIRYDILFADISMPEIDGISLGIMLQELLSDTILVYISSREDLVFDTFRAQPFRFIRKKNFHAELPELTLAVCEEIIRRKGRKIAFQCGASSIMLQPEKIVYVESYKKIQIIHYENQTFEVQSSLQKIMAQLKEYGFVQTHKSYYVNCRYIHSIDRNTLQLDDHTQIPIGRSKLNNVKEAFLTFSTSIE